MDSSTVIICWISPIVSLRVSGSILLLLFYFDGNLSANNVDPGQKPHYVASDLGLHRLPMTLLQAPCKNGLTLKAPNKNCSRQHFNSFFFYLSKKIRLDFSSESSA